MWGNRWLTASVIALSVTGSGFAQAQGEAHPGEIKAETCMGCHGIPGYTNAYPTYPVPKLAGQEADYIIAALKAYAAGTRAHRTMRAQAASLSTQDMEDIAAYFSAQSE
jgi:cytochrome c553